MTEIEQYTKHNAVTATIGEYNNYYSEGLFVELNEPLFVKKNWVPCWLWGLFSEPRLSYFEHENQSVGNVKVPIEADPQDTYNFKYNDDVNDPSYVILIENKGDIK